MRNASQKAVAVITALPGAGHLTVAIIYLTMGLLAGLVALGLRATAPDIREAIRTLRDQPFGPLLLIVVAAGSICLVGWRLLQSLWDLEQKGKKWMGMVHRARYLLIALIYAWIPFYVYDLLTGTATRTGEQLAEDAARVVIRLPLGWVIVMIAGAGFFTAGGYCLYQMCRGRFEAWFECAEMTERQRQVCFTFGRLGYAARGVIYLVVGYCLAIAGWNLNPRQVEGQAGALQVIFQQPLGPTLLGIVSVGLISFGLFSLASLRYGRVPKQRVHEVVENARMLRESRVVA